MVSALFQGCWWFSLVAAISGGDTLIEPHYFQVCGTLRGHQCRGGSCAFNYGRDMRECNMSCSHPSPGCAPLNQSAPSLRGQSPWGCKHHAEPVCVLGRRGGAWGGGTEGPHSFLKIQATCSHLLQDCTLELKKFFRGDERPPGAQGCRRESRGSTYQS